MTKKDFSQIDQNFRVDHTPNEEGLVFRSIREAPFSIHGVLFENGAFRRLPEALASGDTNVNFLDGSALMSLCGDEGTVDRCHPTDLGFFSMAHAIGEVFEKHIFK